MYLPQIKTLRYPRLSFAIIIIFAFLIYHYISIFYIYYFYSILEQQGELEIIYHIYRNILQYFVKYSLFQLSRLYYSMINCVAGLWQGKFCYSAIEV